MKKFYLFLFMVLALTGFTMAQTMENFESLKMNLMLGTAGEDLSTLTVVPNPDPTGINRSAYVVEFLRDKDGLAWGGFYATLPTAVNFDTYKYVHVKVWKSRISPVKFKLERADGNIEIASMNAQTVVNGWEDFVFDFSAATGEYSKIVFMPDYVDPVGLTEDITIYFDDFLVNNTATPISVPEQTFNVDMNESGMAVGDKVFISGALGGEYGTWAEPGTIAGNEMTDSDGDGTYSITLNLPDGLYAFKFFKGTGWGGGDNNPGNDRKYTVNGNADITYKFGADGVVSETHDDNLVLENFESLKMNLMAGGVEDLSTFTVVQNPDPSGVNHSDYVVDFLRDKDGVASGGFYATLDTPIDLTTNKYIHVKVYKSRISPVKFKLERADGDLEIESIYPQTLVNEWEDLVFDFSALTGEYSKIVFMPDYSTPVGLTEDIHVYFDDFLLNDESGPIGIAEQVFNVDMNESGMAVGSTVWISGALGGVNGTWNEPGTNLLNQMTDPDGDGIYSITLQLPDGLVAFKFFSGTGWTGGDTAPGGDRNYTVNGSADLNYKWGVDGITSAKQLSGATFKTFPNPVVDMITVQTPDLKGLTISDLVGRTLKNYQFQTVNSKQINVSDLKSGIYLMTVKTSNGNSTSKFIKK